MATWPAVTGGACSFANGVIRRLSMMTAEWPVLVHLSGSQNCSSWMACVSESLAGSSRSVDDQCLAEMPVADDYDVNGCFLSGSGVNGGSMNFSCGAGGSASSARFVAAPLGIGALVRLALLCHRECLQLCCCATTYANNMRLRRMAEFESGSIVWPNLSAACSPT